MGQQVGQRKTVRSPRKRPAIGRFTESRGRGRMIELKKGVVKKGGLPSAVNVSPTKKSCFSVRLGGFKSKRQCTWVKDNKERTLQFELDPVVKTNTP